MQREKRLTKRERKALKRPAGQETTIKHIHCIACGRHLEPTEFVAGGTAKSLRCQHGSTFASCTGCEAEAVALLAEHDRTGQQVRSANAWH